MRNVFPPGFAICTNDFLFFFQTNKNSILLTNLVTIVAGTLLFVSATIYSFIYRTDGIVIIK